MRCCPPCRRSCSGMGGRIGPHAQPVLRDLAVELTQHDARLDRGAALLGLHGQDAVHRLGHDQDAGAQRVAGDARAGATHRDRDAGLRRPCDDRGQLVGGVRVRDEARHLAVVGRIRRVQRARAGCGGHTLAQLGLQGGLQPADRVGGLLDRRGHRAAARPEERAVLAAGCGVRSCIVGDGTGKSAPAGQWPLTPVSPSGLGPHRSADHSAPGDPRRRVPLGAPRVPASMAGWIIRPVGPRRSRYAW